ncbi:MAG: hypothetical protein O2816_09305, partial [Planctomycetota bacterium]|nr:hypothetical protein [Planctomycetota bacterium]
PRGVPMPDGVPRRNPALADLGTLRLVYLGSSGAPDASPGNPLCWVYERVPGAEVVAQGAPGESLRVSLEFRIDGRPLEWVATAQVGEDGHARLRVPHSGQARWRRGTTSGSLSIGPEDVSGGATLTLP